MRGPGRSEAAGCPQAGAAAGDQRGLVVRDQEVSEEKE